MKKKRSADDAIQQLHLRRKRELAEAISKERQRNREYDEDVVRGRREQIGFGGDWIRPLIEDE
jgi:vacuolar-type H+-ATPase subunit H